MSLSKLISLTNPKSPITEAYRTLRTNIQFSSLDKDIKTICVTSSVPGEGKSTTICNLAITMAQANKKVLLIDADLRKPTVHKQFKQHNGIGLTNILVQDRPIEEVVKSTPVKGLDILTSGPKPPNPSEILGSNAMKEFIERVKEKYDRVLIDCPPVCAVTDPALISTIVDGTILVVSAGRTHIEEAKRSKQLLDNVNANILGVVLNKIPVNSHGYYSKYYYYQYYYDDSES